MPIDPFHWVLDMPFVPLHDLAERGKPGPGPGFVALADNEVGLGDARLRLKLKQYEDNAERDRLREQLVDKERELRRRLDYEYRRALYDPSYRFDLQVRGTAYPDTPFHRGGPWGREAVGPRDFARSDVMLIGKHPGRHEFQTGQNFQGPSSADLLRACDRCGIPPDEYMSWYVTNLVKFDMPGGGSGALLKPWIDDCLPILWQELILVRPKYILCLGADALKGLFGPRAGYNLQNTAGRMLQLTYRAARPGKPVRTWDDLEEHTAAVMAVPHPAAVYREPEKFDTLRLGVGQFWDLSRGRLTAGQPERDIRHRAIYTEAALAEVVDAVRARPGDLTIAIDAEWHGRNWNDEDAYLRTIQFAPAWKEAYCVVLHDPGGAPAFLPSPAAAIAQLRRLVADKPDGMVRVGGHAFRADTPWLLAAGLDLRPFFDIPEGWDPAVMPRGFDTLYLAHAAHEAAESFKLELLAMRYTTCERWDVRLQKWKDAYCKEHKLKDRDLEGYGMCPEDVLIPYGNYDADSTRRLVDVFWGHCVEDSFRRNPRTGRGLDSRVAYLNSMKAWLGFLEVEMTGVPVDLPRVEQLTKLYCSSAVQLRGHIQERLNWPGFNPKSAFMCRELLFGQELNGSIDKATGRPRRLRPAGAMEPLGLRPVKSTSKPSKSWDRVVDDGEEDRHTPSTDKEVLGILARAHDVVQLLRDIKFIAHVGSSVLRPPKPPAGDTDKAREAELAALLARHEAAQQQLPFDGVRTGRAIDLGLPTEPEPVEDDSWGDDPEFDGGFVGYMDRDGRVRSHFYAAETGRCTSSRPNLQNLAKQRDADYRRILGAFDEKKGKEVAPYKGVFGGLAYQYPIRTICRAAPGTVLLEFDLMSAEIAMLAWEADDQVMVEDVRRAMLKEDHPDHQDIHASTAVTAFKLDCPPTKKGLESIGMEHIRTPAKNVRFGVPYGRSPDAIARQCREQGADVTLRDAELLVQAWHDRYRASSSFLSRCSKRATDPGWMVGPFGRFRRFPETSDPKVVADMERQALNYTIQNGVADAISIAIYNIMKYRDANRSEGHFRVVLQIHDALVMEVPVEHVPWVYDTVLPKCVVEGVPVTPLDLDGGDTILRGRPPYHFGIDRDLYVNWGEKLAWGPERDDLIRRGLDPKYLPEEKRPKAR